MKRIFCIATLFFTIFIQVLNGQKKWTLGDCITYAETNNILLKRQRLLTENDRVNLAKSRMDLLPNLNFETDGRVGFGRSIDPVTNLITFKQNISNSFTISSNITLFSGFAGINTLSANKFMLKAGVETEKVARNTLILNILGTYYQVLYTRGLENAAKMQMDLSEKQLFRIRKNVETGREALSKQFEMESRVSEDRLSYTIAVNSSSQALTSLRQILQLDPNMDFDIEMPNLDISLISDGGYRPDSIYKIAAETLPRLKAINYELLASLKQIAAARGALLPRLSVSGAIFTGFYKVTGEGVTNQESFSTQLNNNNSQAVYASLQIPLFNNYSTGRNIKLAKIRKNDNELRLEQEKNSLYSDIENACLNYNRGKDEYLAALSNSEYNKKSFAGIEKKFEAGLVDVTDYSAASTTLFKASTEALRTKLQLMIRKLSIQFYSTGDYTNIIDNQ